MEVLLLVGFLVWHWVSASGERDVVFIADLGKIYELGDDDLGALFNGGGMAEWFLTICGFAIAVT